MKKIILPVITPADLAALPNAVAAMRQMGVTHLWVVHNPTLGVPYPEGAKVLDSEIEGLNTAERSAASRRDYTSAGEYRDKIAGIKVRRDQELRAAYKALPSDQLSRAYEAAFVHVSKDAIPTAEVIELTALTDPLEPGQLFETLVKFIAEWPDQLPHGEYAIAWPAAFDAVDAGVRILKDGGLSSVKPEAVNLDKALTDGIALTRETLLAMPMPKLMKLAGGKFGQKKTDLADKYLAEHAAA